MKMAELNPDQSLPVVEDAPTRPADEAVIANGSASIAAEENVGLEEPIPKSGEADAEQTNDNPEESSMELEISNETKKIVQKPACEFTNPQEMLVDGEEAQPSENSDEKKIDSVEAGNNSPLTGECKDCIDKPPKKDISENPDVTETSSGKDSAIRMNTGENLTDLVKEVTPAVSGEPEAENTAEAIKAQDTCEKNKLDRAELKEQVDGQDPTQLSQTAENGTECAVEKTTKEEKDNYHKKADDIPGDIKYHKMAGEETADIKEESCVKGKDAAQNKPAENEDTNLEQKEQKSEHKNENSFDQKVEYTPRQGNAVTGDTPEQKNVGTVDLPGQENVGTADTPGQGNGGTVDLSGQGNAGTADTPGQGNGGTADPPRQGNNGTVNLPEQENVGTLDPRGQGNGGTVNLPGQGNAGTADLPGQVNGGTADPPGQVNGGTADLPGQENVGTLDPPGQGNGGTLDPPGQGNGGTLDPPGQGNGGTADPPGQVNGGTLDPPVQGNGGTVDLPGQGNAGTADPPPAPVTFQCEKCRYHTRNKVLFDNHYCDNEDEDNDLEETTLITLKVDESKTYHCSECNISGQGHAFEEHLMCHIILRPYKCLYCSLCFINRREIGRHLAKLHAGQKMNCALRALRRAKALMSAALESGTYSFYARVAGKVPLSSDKYRSAKLKDGVDKAGPSQEPAATSSKTDADSAIPVKLCTPDGLPTGTKVEASHPKLSTSSSSPSSDVKRKEVDNTESTTALTTGAGMEKMSTCQSQIQMTGKDNKSSKESTGNSSADEIHGSSGVEKMDTGEHLNQEAVEGPLLSSIDQNEEEENSAGLKIVAAFSLHDDIDNNSCDSDRLRRKAAENSGNRPSMERSVKEANDDTKDSLTRALGPPSKPKPAASFFDQPQAVGSNAQNPASGSALQTNCFFFICGFHCKYSSLTSPEFRDHLMLDHAGESVFSCYHCGYQAQTEDALVRHICAHAHTYSKSAPLYICGASACKFGSNLVADFINHQSSWHSELTVFQCHDCDEKFDSVEHLLKHFEANFLSIINCPHCTAKTTNRMMLLNHISSAHPGKGKMVSVAKQIVCRDRKLNNYALLLQQRSDVSETVVPESPPTLVKEVAHHNVVTFDLTKGSRNKSLVSILTEPINSKEKELTRQAQAAKEKELTRQAQAASARKEFEMKSEAIFVEEEEEDDFDNLDESADEDDSLISPTKSSHSGEIAYMGSKADDRETDNFKCKYCTFIARDRCRLEGHERCHGLPPSRRSRFKCMYCPQGFNNEHKFNSHVSCHPGLIKFSLYCCKRCDFDSNQRHIIVKHVRSTRDQAHMSYGASDDDMYTVVSKTMETRVLECTQCSYMTRHRKHLIQHIKRDHSSPRKSGITVDCDIIEKYPTQPANRNRALELAVNHDRSASLPVGDDGNIRENQARRFKCPICQYLVPRAADLKAHVKRHSEIGEITLVMFRCKYCSAASTAREIIYGHLMEKHLGKQIALVKRIVTIDTKGGDNGYAVTSMEDEEDGTVETHPPAATTGSGSGVADKTVLLIPDSAGETFQSLMECPCCAFASYNRKIIVQHVSTHHPEVNIMGRKADNEVYPLDTSSYTSAASASDPASSMPFLSSSGAPKITLGDVLKGEILIVPDSQTFDEPVICPKCDYATIHRRNIVLHLEQNHPGVSVMGRNDYPTFEGKSQEAMEANATGKDGMVIIGSGSLDEKIGCLYENFGDRMKCMICRQERPKKFFIHVHILRHLNILLWGCLYCSHRGLQKYKMMDHIKKVHPGKAYCIRYLPVNVEEKVNEYLQNASMIRARRLGDDTGETVVSPNKSPVIAAGLQSENDLDSIRLKHKVSQDRLSGCTIGSEDLDMKLACLYSVSEDGRFKCVVCAQEFQRKFAIHRHIVQSHLKVNLIGCGYCALESVERHIVMDHILETHRSAPISMRNLAENLENKVAEFLSRMTLDADAALDLDEDFSFRLPEPPSLPSMLPPLDTSSPLPSTSASPGSRTSLAARNSPSLKASTSGGGGGGSGSKNQLNPKLMLLGRDVLHRYLQPLLDDRTGLKCKVCHWDFPRRYAVHRHILMKHLKVGIIGCPYCSFEGVERYQVFTHIKEDHRDAELKMRYLDIDLPAVIREFQKNLASGKVDNSRTPPPWSIKKIPKKELSDEDDESSHASGSNDSHSDSLVVAMFGKKSGAAIKEEPADEDSYIQEPLDREVNGDDESSVGFDSALAVDADDSEREVTAMSLQAANGTKAKSATDVQTSIRVITIKENGCKRHVCEKCKFTSLHRSNIVRHIYRVHEQYREQECPACNYKTLSRVLIEQHIRNEHPGTPLPKELSRTLKRKLDLTPQEMEFDSMKKCKAAAFSKRREADRELLNMANGTIYACAYCRFETSTREEIARHTRENHQAVAQPLEGMEEDMKEESEDIGEVDEDRQDGSFEGEDNDFETLTSAVKMNQVDLSKGSEDALWQCYYCSYKTAVEEDLKIHFSEAHSGNVYRYKRVPTWRFVCRSCHVKTRAHSKMRYHLNRHINYRPYTCTTCGSFYPSPDQCRKHCRANNHNETFTYVKIPRKEKRLQELLKECQEIAVALTKSNDTNTSVASSKFFSIPSKRKAKKSFPPTSKVIPAKLRKSYEYDAPYSPRAAPSREVGSSVGGGGSGAKEEIEARMLCGMCEFSAQNVCEVWLHFIKKHEGHEFQWQDSSTGYLCTETGEITNGKDNPPDLEAPPGPGYSQLGKGMLSCHHCQFTTSTVQAMKSHLRRHLPKRFLCPYCSMRCSRRDTINQHVRCGHRGREMWTIYFRLPEGFTAEQNDEEGDKGDGDDIVTEPSVSFQPDENDEDATDVENEGVEKPPQLPTGEGIVNRKARKSLVRPSPPVVTMERIKCGICDLRMESVASVYRHHLENHKEQEFLWVDTTNGYTCRHSGEVMDAKELSPHLFSKDGFNVESDTSNVPTFACKFCPFTSAFIQAIKSHMKSHLPHGFMCPYCCMVTNSKEKMISHQSCSHRDQEPWILHLRMPLDGAAASPSTSSLEKNLLQKGTGKTNYACIECDYTTENLTQFRLHLANHGNFQHLVKDIPEDLPFRCGYCVFAAEDEGEFGAHIASHLERRNFRCSKCEYTAFKRVSVLSHIQSSHSETEEVEVIDLQASNISEQGGSVEEPQLVNFSPKVKVSPISERDLNREGLTLYSPPSSFEGDELEEGEDIIGLGDDLDSNVSGDENDDRSDCTEVWGVPDETQREEDPPATQSAINRERGGSILRLTLQGKLTGEYGIKRAIPADLVEEASPSRDSESSDPDSDNNEAGESEEVGEREAGLGEDMMEVDVSQDLSNSG